MREAITGLTSIQRMVSDAVVTYFSDGQPEPHELDEAASDLRLETIEASTDGAVILRLADTCGEHFMEGYWPAVHLGASGDIEQVTVES